MSSIYHLKRQQILPIPIEQAWEFFSTPRNLEIMTPPSLSFRIVWGGDEPMFAGQLIGYRVKVAPAVWVSWLTEITTVDPGRAFVDEQRRGPYRLWHHLHRFTAVPGGTAMLDRVCYQLPFGPLGSCLHALWVRRQLGTIFNFRAQFITSHFGAYTPQG